MIWPDPKSSFFPASRVGDCGTEAPLHALGTRRLFGLEWRPYKKKIEGHAKHLESSGLCDGVNEDTISIA